jgi:predicted Zn-dependent peptidase
MSLFDRASRRLLGLVLTVIAALVLAAGGLFGIGPDSALRAGSAVAQAEEPGIYRTTLPNGIVVVTRERPDAEVAALSIYVRGGSRDEDPETVGAAHFMEHMFFQGTPSRPSSAAIEGPITERGGWLNATTAWEGITFFGTVPNSSFDVLLDTLADILVNSVFDAEAVEKERRVVLEELNRNLNSPSAFAFETFAKTVFADHPAHKMPGGDRTTVRSVTRDTLLQFRDRFFRAPNLVIVAAGDLNHEEVERKVAAAFAAMPAGQAPTFTPSPRPETKLRKEEVSFGARQAQLIMGWPTVGFDSEDRYALEVLATALGSSGQVLAGELRDRLGLVTRVDTGYWALTDAGTWLVAAAAEPDRTDAAVEGILEEIRTVRDEPLDPEELANAKAYVRGSTRRGFQRSIDQAQELSTSIGLGYYQPLDAYLAKIADVTAADVQRVARTYLDPDNYTLVVLGP